MLLYCFHYTFPLPNVLIFFIFLFFFRELSLANLLGFFRSAGRECLDLPFCSSFENYFLSALEKMLRYFHLTSGFWWELCYNSNCCFSVDKASFFSCWSQDFFLGLQVSEFFLYVLEWISLDSVCLMFTELLF
jgi:hypothetical protein